MRTAQWCLIVAVVACGQPAAQAQFATVINVPPQSAPLSIGSETQLNVLDGGLLGGFFSAGAADGTSSNVEVNILGGAVGSEFDANGGATVNISGGYVSSGFDANIGSIVNITGGVVAQSLRATGSQVNVSGGSVDDGARAFLGSVVRISGGTVGDDFIAEDGGTLIVSGGSLGTNSRANPGSTIQISGGVVGVGLNTEAGSVVDISGGDVGGYLDIEGLVNISGGAVGFDGGISMYSGSEVNITGGAIGDNLYTINNHLNITGGDFRLNGVPIAGLGSSGDTLQVNFPFESVFTGILADGTPFHQLVNSQVSGEYSSFSNGTVTLHSVALPAIGPSTIDLPTDPTPRGLRTGQTMTVDAGGVVGRNFNADRGSTVIIHDGQVGDNFEVLDSEVTISGGQIGKLFDAYGDSHVVITGGSIGSAFGANPGSQVDMSGGTIGAESKAEAGSVVNISGGFVGDFFIAENGSEVSISGGTIGQAGEIFIARGATGLNISGGKFGARLSGLPTLHGGEFFLNGQPIAGLDSPGDSLAMTVPFASVLSGTLSDGTPFAFSGYDDDNLTSLPVTLVATQLPPAAPGTIFVSSDVAPAGLRSGQNLVVADSGEIGDNFNAAIGTSIEVTGGQIGKNFEAVAAHVDISGGAVGSFFSAFAGSRVEISGGSVGSSFKASDGTVVQLTGGSLGSFADARFGSIVNIQGGTVGTSFEAYGGSKVNIAGGTVGSSFDALNGSVVSIFGGTVGDHYDAISGSTTNISGGTIGDDFDAVSGSKVNLVGTQFVVGGVDITGTLTPYVPFTITNRNVTLTGLLADGTPFSFALNSSDSNTDFFATGATLKVALGVAGDFNHNGSVDAADYALWRNTIGQSGASLAADSNGDSQIDAADYAFWKANFGRRVSSGAGAISPVPEPAVLTILLTGITVFAFRRRR